MNTTLERRTASDHQLATFRVNNVLLGIAIDRVREINRLSEVTRVPHAPTHVLGVVNLRGEVVPVLDLGNLLGLHRTQLTNDSKNVIVHSAGQLIGFVVNEVSDIIPVRSGDLSTPPANVNSVDGRMIQGIYTQPNDVVIVLDIDQILLISH